MSAPTPAEQRQRAVNNKRWHVLLTRWSGTRKGRQRIKAWQRQQGLCWICGISLLEFHLGRPTWDHLLPVSKGGLSTQENLRLAHSLCNYHRGNADPGSIAEYLAIRRSVQLARRL